MANRLLVVRIGAGPRKPDACRLHRIADYKGLTKPVQVLKPREFKAFTLVSALRTPCLSDTPTSNRVTGSVPLASARPPWSAKHRHLNQHPPACPLIWPLGIYVSGRCQLGPGAKGARCALGRIAPQGALNSQDWLRESPIQHLARLLDDAASLKPFSTHPTTVVVSNLRLRC